MMHALLLSVQFHDGRYNGAGDWPPAPARLFQALIAGVARGQALADDERAVLGWLETLDPPVIVAPKSREGVAFKNYVPNNDLDAVAGDPRRVGEIRAPKLIKAYLFDAADAFLYAWTFAPHEEAERHARSFAAIAARLYQLGRGVDMAWAQAEILDDADIEPRLARHGGVIFRPSQGDADIKLACPQPGSLASLEMRFKANRARFAIAKVGRTTQQLFSQPPKPRFRAISYDNPPRRLLFDIRESASERPDPEFAPWPSMRIVKLAELLRDAAVGRLKQALPEERLIERILVGRGATEADKAQRVRIVPLPSIGHVYVDRAIRRILVEIPPDCPIPTDDIYEAFSGLVVSTNPETGEIFSLLAGTADRGMLRFYGIERPEKMRLWRTVTPAALPQAAARRRIEPSRLQESAEWKGAPERIGEEKRAAGAVVQALRHSGIAAKVAAIRVQREPFTGKGDRAEAFASPRFAKERLWHVEIAFAEGVAGPLIIGDGRYLGLGVMEPMRQTPRNVIVFDLPPQARAASADRTELLRATRRALMALSRQRDGSVPPLFSGHEADGGPAKSGRHEHVFLAGADLDGDERIECLIVAAPWACDRSAQPDRRDTALFERVVSSLATVRAGRLGVISLHQRSIGDSDEQLIGPARLWESHTEYHPARHASRGKEPADALLRDVIAECERRGLPKPEPKLLDLSVGPKGGVAAHLHLRFAVGVRGPLLLGRDSHQGGGLFLAVD